MWGRALSPSPGKCRDGGPANSEDEPFPRPMASSVVAGTALVHDVSTIDDQGVT
jgi:hypothetical protein